MDGQPENSDEKFYLMTYLKLTGVVKSAGYKTYMPPCYTLIYVIHDAYAYPTKAKSRHVGFEGIYHSDAPTSAGQR